MASPDVLPQAISGTPSSAWAEDSRSTSWGATAGNSRAWMVWDGVTVVGATTLATLFEYHMGLIAGARHFIHGTLIRANSDALLISLLCGFILAFIYFSRRFGLYSPRGIQSSLYEQRLTIQACFSAGLLLIAAIYFLRVPGIPRTIVVITIALVSFCVCVRRGLFRVLQYRRFAQGVGTRNLLIVGTGPEADILRHHIDRIRHLGYSFKGFIDSPCQGQSSNINTTDVVGTLDDLFESARKHFVDEIFLTVPLQRDEMQEVLLKARECGVDLRVLPQSFAGLALHCPIEYVGQFPTIPLHRGNMPELALTLKRYLDLVLSSLILLVLSPLLILIAILIRLDSRGPIFYLSDRIGKKGRVFKCIKFRTMVEDADRRREEVMHLNERDGVLFKITNDPRITNLGRLLRKYSLDELPQFFNVLKGDMSIVGPRPPIGSEVQEYKLDHLRRLNVMPGITGLWQVQARQDPSFDSYISLDLAYVERWTIWLDLKIIIRTIGVVFAGTGS